MDLFFPYFCSHLSALHNYQRVATLQNLCKVEPPKITAMPCQDSLICETEVFLSHGKISSYLGKPMRCDGENPVWFVITLVNPKTKVPMTE
jgi:hypothetical protein